MTVPADAYDGPERREAGRYAASLSVTVREAGANALPATVSDMSPMGCRVTGIHLSATDNVVWLRLPGLESQSARLRWRSTGEAGLAFDRPLHPAVAARFDPVPLARALPAPAAEPAFATGDHTVPLSRREQILRGQVPLAQPITLTRAARTDVEPGLGGMIRRHAARVADHRREPRFPPPSEALLGFRVAGQPSKIQDLSASGVQVETELAGGIGAPVTVSFAGFPELRGTIVWVRQGATGVRLPDDALHLFDAA